MIKNFLNLSFLYFHYLINKKIIFFCISILIVAGFLLIPNESASYVTYYSGKTAIISNKYWIGSIAGVFSNLIIYIIIYFGVAGDREKDIINGQFIPEKISPFSFFFKHIIKIFALFILSLFFLLVLNLSLYITNFNEIDFFIFVIPMLYFCIPFLFFASTLAYFVEYLISNTTIKYLFYYGLIVIFIIFDDQLLFILGSSELAQYFQIENISNDNFAIGIIDKKNVKTLATIQHFITPLHIYYKFVIIVFTTFSVYLLSFVPINRSITKSLNIKNTAVKKRNLQIIQKPLIFVERHNLFLTQLLQKDYFLFFIGFSKNLIITLLLLLIAIILGQQSFRGLVLPIIFILSITPISSFLSKPYIFNTSIQENIAPFNKFYKHISKILVVFSFNILLLSTYFVNISFEKFYQLSIIFLLISLFQYLSISIFKNIFVTNILLIIMYGSCLTNSPILNIFLF